MFTETVENIQEIKASIGNHAEWEPILGASNVDGSHTYTLQKGCVTLIGKLVVAQFYVVVDCLDPAIEGNIRIRNLPVLAANGESFPGTVNPVSCDCNLQGVMGCRVMGNSDSIFIVDIVGGGIANNLNATNLGEHPAFHGTVCYMAE